MDNKIYFQLKDMFNDAYMLKRALENHQLTDEEVRKLNQLKDLINSLNTTEV